MMCCHNGVAVMWCFLMAIQWSLQQGWVVDWGFEYVGNEMGAYFGECVPGFSLIVSCSGLEWVS